MEGPGVSRCPEAEAVPPPVEEGCMCYVSLAHRADTGQCTLHITAFHRLDVGQQCWDAKEREC